MWLPPFMRPRVKTASVAEYSRAYFYPVGAGNAVYHPAFPTVAAMLPIVNFSGNGVLYPHAPNMLFGPMVYAHQTYTVSGIGGALAGTMAHQPLSIPDTTNGSQ